ncbi:hypothetical protein GCM10011614_28450 [Novosphingobium colocasiae]|uniref:Uncharacterized protein n=1 Tax=Novosphingobium colocasiae TaxID=1256513 RepID=A0A918PJU7_9SPHN|nr:hypothetical protein GCM10011614_28450 [Novosphingobium colocasiae]
MPFEQGLAGAELGEDFFFLHCGASLNCCALIRRKIAACDAKFPLEALETRGKRAYRPRQWGAFASANGVRACRFRARAKQETEAQQR